jgi:hypothetical protein
MYLLSTPHCLRIRLPPRNSLSQRTVAFCVCSVFFWIPDIPPPEKSLLAGFWDDAKNGAPSWSLLENEKYCVPRIHMNIIYQISCN